MMEQQDKIILIGAGNVAHHLAAALLKAGGEFVPDIQPDA